MELFDLHKPTIKAVYRCSTALRIESAESYNLLVSLQSVWSHGMLEGDEFFRNIWLILLEHEKGFHKSELLEVRNQGLFIVVSS